MGYQRMKQDEILIHTDPLFDEDGTLLHYGVLGMKWGRRKGDSGGGSKVRVKKKHRIVNGVDIDDDSFMTKYDKHDYRQLKRRTKRDLAISTAAATAMGAGQGGIAGTLLGPGATVPGAIAGATIAGAGVNRYLNNERNEILSNTMNQYRSDYFENTKVRKRRRTIYAGKD